MTKKFDDEFFKRFEVTDEQKKNDYRECQTNPENMSFWLPAIKESTTKGKSVLQLPETRIVQLPYEWWHWLRSENYTDEKLDQLNELIVDEIFNFLPEQKLFMKTGVFSDKFTFFKTVIDDKEKISRNLLDIYYSSMVFGADRTAEVVFREWISNKEGRRSIYSGMPLRTEFRVFYDFDAKEVVGISNYWHPDVMSRGLYLVEDQEAYEHTRELLMSEFDQYKRQVAKEVSTFMKGCNKLRGKWSVDIMKNGDDFWLIDMARMELSALVGQMEIVSK